MPNIQFWRKEEKTEKFWLSCTNWKTGKKKSIQINSPGAARGIKQNEAN